MQHPILTAVAGGAEDETMAWEGRTQIELAVLIDRYLAAHPCPGASRHPASYAVWTGDLREAGAARLEAARARRLRVA